MKKTLLILIGLIFLSNAAVFAKPERLQIKTQEARGRHNQAKTLAKAVDLSNVEDPEARKAFKAIFQTLNMQTKK